MEMSRQHSQKGRWGLSPLAFQAREGWPPNGDGDMEREIARRQFVRETALGAVGAIMADRPRIGGKELPIDLNGAMASPAGQTSIPVVEPIVMLSGALLADSFEGTEIDSNVWSRPNWMTEHNPYIAVGVQYSQLLISGVSHPGGKDNQYVGILSKYFRATDVVLAARMRVQSPFEKKGRIRHIVHLCTGDWPDFFMEVSYGQLGGGPPRWSCAYVDRIWSYPGYASYLEPSLAATGNEAVAWHDVLIEHNGRTNQTRAFLVVGNQWKQIGPSAVIPFNHSHVELKVDVGIADTSIRMQLDDVRLYLNPADYPVTLVVTSRVTNDRPEVPIHDLKVHIVEETSGKLLGKGLTDESGQAHILLPSNLVYPIPATIEVWSESKQLLRANIPRYAVRGLYPGDVWAVGIPPKVLFE